MNILVAASQDLTLNKPAFRLYAMGKLSARQLLVYPRGSKHVQNIASVYEPVHAIAAEEHAISFSNNRWLGYHSLILATGSKALELPPSFPGRDLDGVITLHNLQSYHELRRRLPIVRRAVVVGGGIQAADIVHSLLEKGIHVHWIIRNRFMGRFLDSAASTLALNSLQQAGLHIATQTEIIAFLGRSTAHRSSRVVSAVVTNHGPHIPCDLVLVCIGTTPDITLAERCTTHMQIHHGIVVDEHFQSSVPDIYAIGDVASIRHPQKAYYEPRGTWSEAQMQGHLIARYLCGYERGQPLLSTSWQATRLGKLSILSMGDPLTEGDDRSTYICTHNGYRRIVMQGHRLIGYLYLGNRAIDTLSFKRIIDERIPIQNVDALLTSTFDARTYLAQQQSQQARRLFAQPDFQYLY